MTVWRIVGGLLAFVVVFASGFWLEHSGKPYGVAFLTVHKLVALAVAVLLLVGIFKTAKMAPLSPTELTAAVVTGLLFLGTGIVGGLLATEKPMPAVMVVAHQVMPFLTAGSIGVTLYFLLSRR